MRTLFLLIILLFSTFAYSSDYSDHPEYTVVNYCYTPENEIRMCNSTDCGTNLAYFATCVSVDCSKSPGNPVQIGNTCNARPPCNPENYEYGSPGECVICPPPGVYDNNVCNTCPAGQTYSRSEGQCVKIQCSEDFELFMGSCTRKCQSGFIRNSPLIDPNFYPWECVRKPTTCQPDEILNNV